MPPLAARLPARRLAMALLRRGLVLWLLVRAMLVVVGLGGGGTTAIAGLSPLATIALIVTVGALGVLESRRLNEHRFFANLGVSPLTTGLLGVLPALLSEILVALLTRS